MEEKNGKTLEKEPQKEVRYRKKKYSLLADTFIAEDIHSVIDHVWSEVIVPSIKTAIVESFKTGVDRIFYGDNTRIVRNQNPSGASYNTAYYLASSMNAAPQQQTQSVPRRSIYEREYDSEAEAIRAYADMLDSIRRYKVLSILDYYDISQMSCGNSTDKRWGWASLPDRPSITHLRGGKCVLNMPRPLPIDD